MNLRSVKDIQYQLLPGQQRVTTDIVIERDGIVIVRPPVGFKPEQIDAIVDSKRMWIYKSLAEWRDLNATAVMRKWVNGETFIYLGRHYRLALVHDQELPLKLKDGYFYLQREIIDREGEAGAKKAFEKFYTEKGLVRIKQRLTYFTPKVGVEYRHVRVKELGFRWASCTKNADLYFNWKCMMAPLKIIDYILVHELCHIRYRDHSDVFWNEIDKVMPDYRERKEWLKKHGARFDL